MNNRVKHFTFSESFLESYLIEDVKNYPIKTRTVVINVGTSNVEIAGRDLKPLTSSIYSNLIVKNAEKLVCVVLSAEPILPRAFSFSKKVTNKWRHAYEIFSMPHLKQTQLWRSEKDRAGNVEFNLWFASTGTNCGIHKTHDFRELHTQIYGLGRMQKFRENNTKTLYNEVLMAPGYTHEPFYDRKGIYPWHQYYADSDCIWLAIEFYDSK
jgi:hypothetical protein